jgi:hypothetical protein
VLHGDGSRNRGGVLDTDTDTDTDTDHDTDHDASVHARG